MRLALVAVAVLALVAAACGGVENEPNLAKAAERTEETGSFAFSVTTRATPDEQELGDMCEGAVDNQRELARLTCEGGLIGDYEALTIDDTTYTRHSGDEKWSKEPATEEHPLDEFSPAELLELLRSASRKTERVGEEDVRGEPAVQYALTVDCEQAELVECLGSTAVVDVWIDSDGLVRRIRIDDTELTASIEFFDFGKEVLVAPPPAALVTEQIGDLLGGLTTEACAPDEVRPIGVDQAVEALSRNGFGASAHELGCSGPFAAEIVAERGPDVTVSCAVLTSSDGRAMGFVTSELGGPPEAGTRSLANVDCTLYAYEEDSDAALDALDRALAELKRGVGG